MAEQHVTLRVGSTGADKVASDAGKVKSSWLDTAAKLTIVAAGVGKAFSLLASAMAEPMRAAAQYAKDSAQLDTALARLGKDVDKTRTSFDAFADRMQRTAGVSMDTVTGLQRLWVQLTGNADGANKASEAALQLSSVLGIDTNSAMRLLSQAAEGNVSTLARYIPAVRNLTKEQIASGKAIDLVAEKFGGSMQAALDNSAAQYDRLSNIIMDRYLEALALTIVQNSALSAGLNEIGNIAIEMAPNMSELSDVISDIAVGVVQAFGSMVDLGARAVATFYRIKSAGLDAMLALAQGQLAIAAAIGNDAMITGATNAVMNISMMRIEAGLAEAAALSFADKSAGAFGRVVAAMEAARGKQGTKARAGGGAMQEVVVGPGGAEAVKKELDASTGHIANFLAWRARAYDEAAEAELRRATETLEAQEAMTKRVGEAASWAGEQFGAMLGAVATGSMTAREALAGLASTLFSTVIDSVVNSVTAYMIQAQAASFAANAGVPGIGFILGTAAAAAAGGFIKALLGQLKSQAKGFYFGGLVTGGQAYRDSVPAMLAPGERVLSREQARTMADASGGGSTSSVTFNVSAPLGMGDSVAVMRQYERALVPALERMAATGRLSRMLSLAGAR